MSKKMGRREDGERGSVSTKSFQKLWNFESNRFFTADIFQIEQQYAEMAARQVPPHLIIGWKKFVISGRSGLRTTRIDVDGASA